MFGNSSWLKSVLSQASQFDNSIERERYLSEACGDNQEALEKLKNWFIIQKAEQSPLDIAVSQLHGISAKQNTSGLDTVYEPPEDAKYGLQTIDIGQSDDLEKDAFAEFGPNHASDFIPERLCGTRIGPYKLLHILGRGGMGVVYEAKQLYPINRSVALKLIDFEFSSIFSRVHFEAERKALELMDHPGITGLLDAGVTSWGSPYYVMELVRGVPIHQYCKSKDLPLEDKLRLFISLCAAVQHAHQKGIVHRDLKPSNVLVTERDGKPVVKLIDFGIALNKELLSTNSTPRNIISVLAGTPMYMSPEQASGNTAATDTRSDVYSLGVILFKLLTQTTPVAVECFAEKSHREIIQLMLETQHPLPSEKVQSQSPAFAKLLRYELDWIVSKAMHKQSASRYATPLALAEDIDNFLTGRVVKAKPPRWQYLSSKWIQSNLPVIIPASISFVVLAIATLVSLMNLLEVRKAQAASKRLLINADMKLASEAFIDGNFRLARDRLERHLPSLDEDIRNSFAWRYLWKRVHPELFSNASEFKIFDISYHPHRDEYVTSHDAGELLIWRLDSSVPSYSLRVDAHTIRTAKHSPNGELIATGNVKGILRLWDSNESTLRATLKVASGYDIHTLTWIDDDRIAVTSGALVVVLDVSKVLTLSDPKSIKDPELSNFGKSSVQDSQNSSTVGGTEDIFKECVIRELGPFPGSVYGIAVNPQKERMSVASQGEMDIASGAVSVWDITQWRMIDRIALTSKATSLSYYPDSESLPLFELGVHNHNFRKYDLLAIGTQTGMLHTYFLSELDGRPFSKAISTAREHTSNVHAMQFSHDGRYIVSVSKDATVRIWSALNLNCLQTIQSHLSRVYGIAFKSNSYKFLTVGWDAKIRAFEASRLSFRNVELTLEQTSSDSIADQSLQPLAKLSGQSRRISPGKHFVSGWEGNSGILSIQDGRFEPLPFWDVTKSSVSRNNVVAIGLLDSALVQMTPDGIERLDIPKPLPIDIDHDGVKDRICGFGEEGYQVYSPSAGSDPSPRLAPLDLPLRVRVSELPLNSTAKPSQGTFSFVSMVAGQDANYFHFENGQLLEKRTYEPELSTETMWHSHFSQNSKKLSQFFVTPRSTDVIYYSNLAARERKVLKSETHNARAVRAINTNPLGEIDFLAILDESQTLDIYRLTGESELQLHQKLAIPSDVQTIETIRTGGTARIYLASLNGIFYTSWEGEQFSEQVTQVKSMNDIAWQKPLAANVVLYDLEDRKILGRFYSSPSDSICLAVSKDGSQIAASSSGSIVRIGNASQGLSNIVKVTKDSKNGMVFTPDGNRLCIAVGDNVWFVNPKTNKLIKIGKSHDNTVNAIELSPTGKWVATGSGDLGVYLWDPTTGASIKSFVGHRQAPMFLAFSNDERWLASADSTGTIKIWDIQTGGELLELRDFQGHLKGLDFHQDASGRESLFALGVQPFEQSTANLLEWFVID